MIALKLMLVILFGMFSIGSAVEGSDSTTVQEQTKRRRQEELNRVARRQTLDRFQFDQKLSLFDQRLRSAQRNTIDRLRPGERSHLKQSLDQIQKKEVRRQSRFEQNLNSLELSERNGGLRQKQELNRLRHRQRSEAFVQQQKIKRRRNRLIGRGRAQANF